MARSAAYSLCPLSVFREKWTRGSILLAPSKAEAILDSVDLVFGHDPSGHQGKQNEPHQSLDQEKQESGQTERFQCIHHARMQR